MDTTVLIAHLRGRPEVGRLLRDLLASGHDLAVCCVNVAEVERGIRPKERKALAGLLARLDYLATTREAAARAGRYQAEGARQGRTLHLGDALVAGTARVHGATLLTDNTKDFPMRDLRVVRPTGPESR